MGKKRSTALMETDYTPCFKSHKPLKIGNYLVEGGSCAFPPEGKDLYVGLDLSMLRGFHHPWNNQQEVLYLIGDMQCPKNPDSFKKMIEWLGNQLHAGKQLHVGCIGGHGRTGMVLTALVKTLTDEEDPLKYVREHYCKKAVETQAQIEFLVEHFGIKPGEPTKLPPPVTVPQYSYSGGFQSAWSGKGKNATFHPTLMTNKNVWSKVFVNK